LVLGIIGNKTVVAPHFFSWILAVI